MMRFHDLDALRAFAMLLGIVLHATVFLLPGAEPEPLWPVQLDYAYEVDVERNPYGYALVLIHGMRMPLFFMLSGFFTAMMWQSRGLRRLGEHRLKRIGLPLVIFLFTIIPLTYWLSWPGEFGPLDWLTAWLLGLFHLWFLLYLLALAGGFMLAAWLGCQFRHWGWWLLIPLTLLPQYFNVEGFGADTPTTLLPAPQIIGLYAVFFVFGAFFYQRGIAVRRWWSWGIALALIIFPFGLVATFTDSADSRASAQATGMLITATLLKCAYAWLMIFGMMGLFRWVMSGERFWVRYMSDASYWLYVAHVPLVIAGQQLAKDLDANPHLAFAVILAGTTGILLAIYQVGVRYTPVGTMLNGRRTRRGRVAAHGAG